MLFVPPPANEDILPQARQGSYFFNRIGQKQSVVMGREQPRAVTRRRVEVMCQIEPSKLRPIPIIDSYVEPVRLINYPFILGHHPLCRRAFPRGEPLRLIGCCRRMDVHVLLLLKIYLPR